LSVAKIKLRCTVS